MSKILHLDISLSQAVSKHLARDDWSYISVADPVTLLVVALKQLPLGHHPLQVVLDDSDSAQEGGYSNAKWYSSYGDDSQGWRCCFRSSKVVRQE